MSRAANTLKTSDVTSTPIKLKYTSSYNCSTLGGYGIEVLTGVNGPVTITGSVAQQTINYLSVRHLYYSNYLTGSFPVSASYADNFLQSTAASGTLDADLRYFPTQSNAEIVVISIPRSVYGEQISRKGFIMSSSAYYITDDGNGNIIDQAANNTHVGNIIYPQGIVIFTNSDYLNIVTCPTGSTTTTTSTTSTTTTVPTTTTTSTTTSTTTEPTTTTTSTTTSTTTALGPAIFNLGYDLGSSNAACENYAANITSSYYSDPGELFEDGTRLYDDISLTVISSDGWYSDGTTACEIVDGNGVLTNCTSCIPLTTTTSTTTSTTTEPTTTTTSTTTSTTTEPTTTTTSTTTSTTTEPTTTTTSTTTSTTTEPTTTTTTTSTTTSTTTEPTTTTTSTTSTTTTEPTTTTTSTTTSTTTEPTTTTTSTTTSTTTEPTTTTTSTTTSTTTEPTTTTTTTSTTSTTTTVAYYYYTATPYLNCVQNGASGGTILRSTNGSLSGWVCASGIQHELVGTDPGPSYSYDVDGDISYIDCASLPC